MSNTNNAVPINLSVAQGSNIYYLTNPQGINYNIGSFYIDEHGDARNIAGYVLDSWKTGPWLIQAGARLENLNAHQRTCNDSPVQYGSGFDLYDNAVSICNGTWDYEHYVRTRPTFTGGVNYEIHPNMSAYLRLNTGVHYDDFDNGIRQADLNPGGFLPLQTIKNYEVGFKWQPHLAYIDISAYSRTFNGLQATESTPEGAPIPGHFITYGSYTYGADFDGYVGPFHGLSLRVIADYMHGVYQHDQACFAYTNIYGTPECASINGAPIQRQPKDHFLAQPSYTVAVPWGDFAVWMNVEYVGQRYEDQSGLQPLGTYTMLGGGIDTDIGDHWELTLQGTNLTNTVALTEGNARIFGAATGLGGVLLGRPYPGREVNVTANYKF
jgi:TonB dependent receptor-like, beta-barrel